MTIPTGFAEVTLHWTGLGAPNGADVVFGVQNQADQPAGDIVGDAGSAFIAANLDDRLADDVSITLIKVKLGPDETGASAEAAVSIPGTQGATSVTPAVSALAKKGTAIGGRRGRGRMYFPGVSDTTFDDSGIMNGAAVTAWNTALAAFLTELDSRDIPMVLLHSPATIWQLQNGQPRRVPTGDAVPAPYLVTTLTIDGRAGTQRRRQRS